MAPSRSSGLAGQNPLRMNRALSIAVTVAAATLVAGCGGHGGGAAPKGAGGAPTRAGGAQNGTGSAALVVVGDSLAAGRFADSQAEAFPQRVAAATHARLEVSAVVGATTAQLAAQAVPGGGKVVVVEAGTNDFLSQTPRRRFADDYRALLAKVTAASPGARLVCLTIWIPKDAAGSPPDRIGASFYDATIRRACTAGAVADISPLFDAQPPLRGPAGRPTFLGPGDDFHPNSTGHAAIARLIESRLRAR
jgi:acyl-CoA thioesterase-1